MDLGMLMAKNILEHVIFTGMTLLPGKPEAIKEV
jgi:hypothetical protein